MPNYENIKYISTRDIVNIHDGVVKGDPLTYPGIMSPGLIDSIVQRPKTIIQTPGGSFIPFPDLFSKAASLFEAICRWHPFVDGNKRTAMYTTSAFLFLNGWYIYYKLEDVRFATMVADPNYQISLEDIKKWLRKRSSRFSFVIRFKSFFYYKIYLGLFLRLVFSFCPRYVLRKIEYWLAFDIYPGAREEFLRRLELIGKQKK